MAIDTEKLVTVFGGAGFLGRYVVRALAKRGHRIRVASRRPDLAHFLQVAGNMGQVVPIQANLRYPASVERAVEHADHVINLVGILAEGGRQRFDAVHSAGAGAVAEAARRAGAGLTQISAIGADPRSESDYARSKGEGEAAVFAAMPGATILRPSIIFGAEDRFFNRFAEMARFAPVLPLIGGGTTRFQPVYVNDVAEAVAGTVDGTVAGGRVYELGGPEILTFREMLEIMLGVVQRKRGFLTIPVGAASGLASLLKILPNAPITEDQVRQLQVDNVVSDAAIAEGRTLAAFGIQPQSLESILPTYLIRFRKQGQFATPGATGGSLRREKETA